MNEPMKEAPIAIWWDEDGVMWIGPSSAAPWNRENP